MATLALSLAPASLGPFRLGDSLFGTLAYLRSAEGRRDYGRVSLLFDAKDPATGLIIVTLLPNTVDLSLVFISPTQTLSEIQLSLPSAALSLSYASHALARPASPLSRKDVSRVFGPTFAEEVKEHEEVWYPGLGFQFGGGPSGRADECSRVWVCERNVQERQSVALKIGRLVKTVVDLLTSSLTLYLATTSGTTIVHVAVGQTTASDLLADLGTPGKVFEKTDDRLGIHRAALSADDEQTDAEGAYFWNYFALGLDFLILPTSAGHVVQKIVLHSNLPGAVLWGRYERCPWVLKTPSGEVDVTTPVKPLLDALSALLNSTTPSPATGVLAHVSYPTTKTSSPDPPSSSRPLFAVKDALKRSMPLDRTLDGSWGAGILLNEGGGSKLVAAGTGAVLEVVGDSWVEGMILF